MGLSLDRWRNPVTIARRVTENTEQQIRDNGRKVGKLKRELEVQNRLAIDAGSEGNINRLREVSEIIATKQEELNQTQIMQKNLTASRQHMNRTVNTTTMNCLMRQQIRAVRRLDTALKVQGSNSNIVDEYEKSLEKLANISEEQEQLSSTTTNLQHSTAAKTEEIMNKFMRDCNLLPAASLNNQNEAVNEAHVAMVEPQNAS